MATKTTHGTDNERSCNGYGSCIVTPMTSKEGAPIVQPVHIVDALIVGGIVFFSLLLGTTVPQLLSGEIQYIGVREIMHRLLTAGLAFCLTFLAQWARYRGIQLIKILNEGSDP